MVSVQKIRALLDSFHFAVLFLTDEDVSDIAEICLKAMERKRKEVRRNDL